MITRVVALFIISLVYVISIANEYNGAFDKIPEIGAKKQSPMSLKTENEEGILILKIIHAAESVSSDIQLQEYTERLVENLSKAAELKKQKILPVLSTDNSFNASALPGGVMLINLGLFIYLQSYDQLAFVLAHELAHIKLKVHSFAAEKAWDLLASWALVLSGAAILDSVVSSSGKKDNSIASSIAYASSISGFFSAYEKLLCYSRQDENEADQIGIDIIIKAGYSPRASIEMFKLLQKSNTINNIPEFLLTHPYTESRIIQATNRVIQFEESQKKLNNNFYTANKTIKNNIFSTNNNFVYNHKSYNNSMSKEQYDEFFLMKVRAQILVPEQNAILYDQIKEKHHAVGLSKLSTAEKYALAIFYLKNNKLDEANKIAQILVKDNRINSHFSILQSQIYQAMGMLNKSLQTVCYAIKLKPNNYPLLAEKIKLLQAGNNYKEAEQLAQQLCETRKLDPNVWRSLSDIQNKNNNKMASYISMSNSFFLRGMFPEAKEQLYQLLKMRDITKITKNEITEKLRQIETTEKKINKI